MKKLFALFALTLCVNLSFGKGTEPLPVKFYPIKTAYSEKDYVIAFCRNYAPEYVSMLESSYSSPNSWSTIVNGVPQTNKFNAQNQDDLIAEFESIIHESTHQKNSIYGFLVDPNSYYELTNEEIIISRKFFKSELIGEILSSEAKEKIFRFKTYVSKGSSVGANNQGIVGLMDEYSAYQNGCTAALTAYDNALKEKDTALAIKFYKAALATHFAYYEFNVFIGAYLKYAKLNNPEVYKQIMNLTTLRKAYTKNSQHFLNSIQIIHAAPNRLKRNFHLVKYSFDHYEKDYVEFAKNYMSLFDSDLKAFVISE